MSVADRMAPLRDRPRRLLAVFAHPDDETYGCAGVLARAGRDPQAAVALLCLSSGEASSAFRARGLDRAEIAALREDRMRQVTRRLGADALLLPGLPDGRLARLPLAQLGGVVADVLAALQPQVVVGHDPRGVNGHADHIAAHWAVRRASEAHTVERFAMVAYPPEVVEAVHPRLLFPTPPGEIDVVVELGEEEIQAKEECLRIHDALVTLREDGPPELLRRPPIERYDLWDEDHTPPLGDLFEGLAPGQR